MARRELSFSIVDDDDEEDYGLDNAGIEGLLGAIGGGQSAERKIAMNKMQQVSKEYESSDESHLSPMKKLPKDVDDDDDDDNSDDYGLDNASIQGLLSPVGGHQSTGAKRATNKLRVGKDFESPDESRSSPNKNITKSSIDMMKEVGKDNASCDESPNKNLIQMEDNEVPDMSLSLPAGPSNGRQTVTKIRPPPHMHLSSESDSDDSEMVMEKKQKANIPGEYNPKIYEDLEVNGDIKEIFQYIAKYVPQHLGQDYKFKPFVPDFLPAVGDIDAFLKVFPPDVNINGEPAVIDQSELGIVVLDEPAANQSDPAVLHLQLRASSVNVSHPTEMVIKKVDNLEKNSKTVDKWIKDISDLHRSKSSPVFKYTNPMPDLDELMEEWPENMENLLKIHGFPSYTLRGPLSRYIDIVCSLFDIPIYENRIQSLHLLFSLYAAVKTSNLYRAANGTSKTRQSTSGEGISNGATDQLVLE